MSVKGRLGHRVSEAAQQLERRLTHPVVGWVLLVILVLLYAWAYMRHPLYPGTGTEALNRGWWTWNDQQRYLNEAQAIASGTLDQSTYHYPLGYPALGTVLVWWMPGHPFFLPDLFLIVAGAFVWWNVARRWLSATATLLLSIAFVATHRELIGITMIVPWNTIATQTTIWAGIYVALRVTGASCVLWLAGLAASTYVIRPVDAVTFAPLLVVAVCRISGWRARFLSAFVGLITLAIAVLAVGLLNQRIFAQWRTPYDVVSSEVIGFFGYPIAYKLYWLLVDGSAFFNESEPGLLFRYPWLMLALPGIVYLIRRERSVGVAITLALMLNVGLYLNYNDLLPSDIYRFTLIHYLTWSFPVLAVLSMAALRNGLRDRAVQVSLVAAAAIAVLAVGIRLAPYTIGATTTGSGGFILPPQRPVQITFPHAEMASIGDLRLEGRGLVEYSQYLTPYVPSELKLLLGRHAVGSNLTLAEGSKIKGAPVVSEFHWRWSPVWSRINPRAETDD